MGRTRKVIRSKLSSTRKRMASGGLRTSYGTVTLPKGLRLYHASTSSLCKLPKKPVLFLTLHPSEWHYEDAYISVVELVREVNLLFMIKYIHQLRILSALNEFLEEPHNNMAKTNYDNIQKWIPSMQKESLDGWLSSIENRTAIEFAIINDPSILRLVECNPIKFNWTNTNYNKDMILVPKKWGTTYAIHTNAMPLQMHLHKRFRPQIEAYKKKVEEEDPDGTALSLLLKNATVTYFDGPIDKISWPM
jgi:hypothetical protein